jgi:hypothetical protein
MFSISSWFFFVILPALILIGIGVLIGWWLT